MLVVFLWAGYLLSYLLSFPKLQIYHMSGGDKRLYLKVFREEITHTGSAPWWMLSKQKVKRTKEKAPNSGKIEFVPKFAEETYGANQFDLSAAGRKLS